MNIDVYPTRVTEPTLRAQALDMFNFLSFSRPKSTRVLEVAVWKRSLKKSEDQCNALEDGVGVTVGYSQLLV